MAATTVIPQINLPEDRRAERKLLITVVEWTEHTKDGTAAGADEQVREILGKRTEDSAIEYNADIQTSTDILGINYTDVNKTQPEQSFDPFLVLGGSRLAAYLNDIRRRNALSELSDFTVYVITAYIGQAGAYAAEKQTGCTIEYQSLGGDANVNFPIVLHFSNNTKTGTVDKLSDDFAFTQDAAV